MESINLEWLKAAAGEFAIEVGAVGISELFGVTDGKAVGTLVEHRFHHYLEDRFGYQAGSSANGIDCPALNIDYKVTSFRQPQSSCPYASASQKVHGLGYHLIVFVYDKIDDSETRQAYLTFRDVIFIDQECTGDYQTTQRLRELLERDANVDDIVAFLEDRNLPLDEIGRQQLAEEIMEHQPPQGYLTISNAQQWRLQYRRAMSVAGTVAGVERLSGESNGNSHIVG